MKLVIAIVNRDDSDQLKKQLTQAGFSSTTFSSTGGFLNADNTTFLVGVDEERVNGVMDVVRSCCHSRSEVIPAATEPPFYPSTPMDTVVGGATMFVVDTDHFERL